MKKYIVKDTIKNQKTGETLIYYTGVDGYVHNFPEFAEGYARKGNAYNNIKRVVNDAFCGRNQKINDTQYIEAQKWLHTLEVVTVEQ